MKPNLESMVTMAGTFAHLIILQMKQELMPTWVLISASGQSDILATPWRNDAEKEYAKVFMREQIKQRNAIAYSFVVETWLATYDKPDDYEKVRPKDRVDRKEAVMALASNGTETLWRTWLIHRDWNEQIIALEEQPEIAEPFGWMADLLK